MAINQKFISSNKNSLTKIKHTINNSITALMTLKRLEKLSDLACGVDRRLSLEKRKELYSQVLKKINAPPYDFSHIENGFDDDKFKDIVNNVKEQYQVLFLSMVNNNILKEITIFTNNKNIIDKASNSKLNRIFKYISTNIDRMMECKKGDAYLFKVASKNIKKKLEKVEVSYESIIYYHKIDSFTIGYRYGALTSKLTEAVQQKYHFLSLLRKKGFTENVMSSHESFSTMPQKNRDSFTLLWDGFYIGYQYMKKIRNKNSYKEKPYEASDTDIKKYVLKELYENKGLSPSSLNEKSVLFLSQYHDSIKETQQKKIGSHSYFLNSSIKDCQSEITQFLIHLDNIWMDIYLKEFHEIDFPEVERRLLEQ